MQLSKTESKSRKPRRREELTARRGKSNRPQSRGLLWLCVVLVLTFVVYLPIFKLDFLNYDDDLYITKNPYIVNMSTRDVRHLFTHVYVQQYAPVAMVIMGAEFTLFGLRPWGFKLVSLLFHLANVVLVYRLIWVLFPKRNYALLVAALFAFHSLQVESVAWLAASMKFGPFTLFFLAALLLYVRYLDADRIRWYVLSVMFFLLSCFSKEQAVSLAVTLFLIDYMRGRAMTGGKLFLDKVPFFVIALIFGIVTLNTAPAEAKHVQLVTLTYSVMHQIIFTTSAFVAYLVKLVLPADLSFLYCYPMKGDIPFYWYLSPVVPLALIYGLCMAWKKDDKTLVFGILFYLVNIGLPFLTQIMGVRASIMADRYVYLPCIGWFLVVAYVVHRLIRRWPHHRWSATVVAAAYVLVLATLTFKRIPVWKDSRTLFSDVVAKQTRATNNHPFLADAYKNLGNARKDEGDPEGAMAAYNKGIEMSPENFDLYNNRGTVRKSLDDLEGALADYAKTIELNPNYYRGYLNRGNLYFTRNEYGRALADYAKAVLLNPDKASVYLARGAVYASQQKLEAAVRDFTKAIRLDPYFENAYSNRALTYYHLKKYELALADTAHLLQLAPRNPKFLSLHALNLMELDRLDEAESAINRAISVRPDTGLFYRDRSLLYKRKANNALALGDALKARSLGVPISDEYLESLK